MMDAGREGVWIWPSLLRAGVLALRPARMVFAFALVMTLAVLVAITDAVLLRNAGEGARGLGAVIGDQLAVVGGRASAGKWVEAVFEVVRVPAVMFRAHAGATMILALPVAAAAAVFGGAIARSAATEFARGERMAWADALALAMRKWWTQALALLLPLVLIGVVAAVLAVLGKVMLGSAATSWVGGMLFGLAACVGVLVVLALAVFVLALPMLVPGVLVEGTDSIDSIQRGAAYVVARPGRYVLYAAVLISQLVVVTAVVAAVVRGAFAVTGVLAAMFVHEPYDAVLRQAAVFGIEPGPDAAEFPAWQARAGSMVVFWKRVFQVLPAAYVVSFFFSAGSVLYLSMRRLCDGQDPGELWHPGDDDARIGRAEVGGEEEEL
jgi:hypothetical protein